MTAKTPQPRWLNEQDVARLTGLSVHTLRAYRQKRVEIPYIKIGRSVRYAVDDLTEYMSAHRICFAERTEGITRG